MGSRKVSSSVTVPRATRPFRIAAAFCALALAAGLVGITPQPASAIPPTIAVKPVKGVGGSAPPTALDGTLLFIRVVDVLPARGDCRMELWKSDGTEQGTAKVKDISQTENCSEFEIGGFPLTFLWDPITSHGFFAGDDGIRGWELWRSDGTEAGTGMIKDINPGSEGSFPEYFTHVGETLFFSADDGANGRELWRSDGTGAGTVMVKDINPGPEGSSPRALTDVAGTLFFVVARDGHELWKSDGTEAGTVMVKDFGTGGFSFPGEWLTDVGGTLFFAASDGIHGFELWRSDGTEEGTVMVKDINPGSAASGPNNLTDVDGTLFFMANDGTHGRELWKSDGTENKTTMVKDINPGSAHATPGDLINLGGTLFFSADDGVNERELWRSDGSDMGTVMVKNIDPGGRRFSPGPVELTDVDGTLFFSADDRVHGRKLWRSDGTEEGTVMVREFRDGPTPSFPRLLTEMDGILFFFARSETNSVGLWKTVPSSGRVVGLGPRLLRRDGVAQGRVRLLEENRRRCVRRVPVRVQRRSLVGGPWRTIRNPRTDMRGVYRTARRILLPDGQPRPGRYRAVTPRFTFTAPDGAEVTCPRAVSPVRRVPRR